MFLWLWQVFRGYVMIEVTGFSVERFMNMAAHKEIYLWDVEYTSGGVAMKVSVEGFRRLRDCAHKTQCRVHIRSKKGAPFLAHRYRKRKVLAGGIVLCLAALYILSRFVWLIDIQGNKQISRDEILRFCRQEGLQIGALQYKIDNKKLKTDIMNHFHNIAWMDIHSKGTRFSIELVETIPKPIVVDTSQPCDIVASKDGLITSIVTGTGAPKVKRGDVVRKGDVLVSGVLTASADDNTLEKPVHAFAEVWARMYHEILLEVPLHYEDKIFSGKNKKEYAVRFFDKEFMPFPISNHFENYERDTRMTQLNFGEDYPLPVIFITHTYREFTPTLKTRTVQQAKELAEKILNARIIREFDFAADITDKSIEVQETEEGVIMKALITTNERIDQEALLSAKAEPEPFIVP